MQTSHTKCDRGRAVSDLAPTQRFLLDGLDVQGLRVKFLFQMQDDSMSLLI